jgi:FixJ family two-component response regulator
MLDAGARALARDSARLLAEQSGAVMRQAYETLTVREREVLSFVIVGLMNKQIAAQLNLSEVTVKVHRGQMMKKLSARSVADLVRIAEALGIEPARRNA